METTTDDVNNVPVPPIAKVEEPVKQPISEPETEGKKPRVCPEEGCGKPSKGPRNGWRCEEHKAAFHASRGGMKSNEPGPPPITKSPAEDNFPKIELPESLGLAEIGRAFLKADAQQQAKDGWLIQLGDNFIDNVWFPMASWLEAEYMKEWAGKIDKKKAAAVVTLAPVANSAAYRVAKRFRKKETPPAPIPVVEAKPVEQPKPVVETKPVETKKEEPKTDKPNGTKKNPRQAGNYSLS